MERNIGVMAAALSVLSITTFFTPATATPATTTPAAERRIGKGDRLKVTISDLSGPGTETKKHVVVDKDGAVDLPYVKQVPAAGRTEAELERDIVEAYRKARILERAQVTVTLDATKKDKAK